MTTESSVVSDTETTTTSSVVDNNARTTNGLSGIAVTTPNATLNVSEIDFFNNTAGNSSQLLGDG